jgi:hypothetical protein
MMHYIRLGIALLAIGVACTKPTADDPTPGDRGAALEALGRLPASDTARDSELRRLEREAFALVRSDGCGAVGQCRTAPVGNRPCGGPRYYFAYCSLTTDSAALFRKLDELARAEARYNQRHGLVSTCEFRGPGQLALIDGSCRFR